MGIDPQKKFHEQAELIKQSISVLKTDNAVPEEEKKVRLAMLEEALQKVKPIRFKDNICWCESTTISCHPSPRMKETSCAWRRS